MTGKLQNVFLDFPTDKTGEHHVTDLSSFCFGALQRKFYLGSNNGTIININMKNGDVLEKVSNMKQ